MNFTEHKEINNLLGTLLLKIKSILGHNIKGAYLYGSLVWGDFDYDISDIDLLVITQNDINEKEFVDLNDAHQALLKKFMSWEDRLEIAYVSTNAIKFSKDRLVQIALMSPGEPFHIKEIGSDWLINWYLIQKKNLRLFGPEAKVLMGSITKEEYLDAVKSQIEKWYDWIEYTKSSRAYQSYAILTMCRALYTIKNGKQVSKRHAALWTQRQYPLWASIIKKAVIWRADYKNKQIDPALTYDEVEKTVREMIRIVSKK